MVPGRSGGSGIVINGKIVGRCASVRRSTGQRKKRREYCLSVEQHAVRNTRTLNLEVVYSAEEDLEDSSEGMGSDYVIVWFNSLSLENLSLLLAHHVERFVLMQQKLWNLFRI